MTVFEPGSDNASAAAPSGGRARTYRQLSFRRERPRYNPLYGRIVGVVKVLLPTIATALIVLIVVWPQLNEQENRFRIGPARIDRSEAEKLRMVNARFTGVDLRQRPFAISSDSADQADPKSNRIALVAPKADILLGNGAWVALTATSGVFDRDRQLLELSGEVNLFHDSGYEFRTSSAVLDLSAGDATGVDPVEGQGPFGSLSAEGFRIYNRGERIEFTGKAKLVIRHGGKGGS